MNCDQNGIGSLFEDIDDLIALLISISALAEARPDLAESVEQAISTLHQAARVVGEAIEQLIDENQEP
jgi:DNA-binding TFAR19-related protein (PDSD5 family)